MPTASPKQAGQDRISNLTPKTAQAKTPTIQRKTAPDIIISDMATDERAEIAEAFLSKHLPEGMTRENTHLYFGDRREAERDVARGYKPAIVHGKALHHGADPLYFIEREKIEPQLTRPAALSRQIISGMLAGENDAHGSPVEGLQEVPD